MHIVTASASAERGAETIDARIARYAALFPDEVILVEEETEITRAELDRRADQVADRLIEAGIEVGATVAVAISRSIDQIAASLGVLKAGAACIPLSPTAPPEMLRFRLADCGVGLTLIREGTSPSAIAMGASVMALGEEPAGRRWPATVAPRAQARDVALIVPSTGSGVATCGVETTHDNVCFVSDWLDRGCGITRGDRSCHIADPGTSTAILEIWPALAAGAAVVIAPDESASDAEWLATRIEQERITMAAAEDALLDVVGRPWSPPASLRLVLTRVGSPVRPALAGPRTIAVYGPEECSLLSVTRNLVRNERAGGPNIGQPVEGAALHILDDQGRPVRRGEEGEIWIGGRGVGRGYRDRPDLTAERFVPDPFGDDPSGMIFRTGRRARALVGGGFGWLRPSELQ